jgi:hypothetical protein
VAGGTADAHSPVAGDQGGWVGLVSVHTAGTVPTFCWWRRGTKLLGTRLVGGVMVGSWIQWLERHAPRRGRQGLLLCLYPGV